MKLKAEKSLLQIPEAEKYLSAILPRFAQERVRSYTTIILSLITLSFFGFFAINPTLSTIADLQKQISDNQFVNQQLKQKISNLTTLQGSYKTIYADIPVLYTALPTSPDVTVLVGQLQTIAENSQVTLDDIQTLAVDVSGLSAAKYNSYTFALDVSGNYDNIQTFLKSITSFNRIVTIDAVALTKSTNSDTYTVSLRGNAYFKAQ